MADPVTWGYVLFAATAAVGAAGAVSSANAAAASSQAQAQANEYTAQQQREQARLALLNAGSREDSFRAESRQQLAKMRAAAAQSGFDSQGGSLGLLQDQASDFAELDALLIRREGLLESQGLAASSALEDYYGQAARRNARAQRTGGYYGAASSILTGATNAYASSFKINGGR
jgi:hypothetical protein